MTPPNARPDNRGATLDLVARDPGVWRSAHPARMLAFPSENSWSVSGEIVYGPAATRRGGDASGSHEPSAHTSNSGSSPPQPRLASKPWILQPRQNPSADSSHISVRQIRQIVRGR